MKLQAKDFWEVEERATPQMKLVAKYEEGKIVKAELQSRTYYAMKTMEKR